MSEQFQLEDLKQLLLSEDDREVIFKLRGSEAVAFMDKLLRTLDSLRSNGRTDQLLFRAEACLLKLSQKSHLLPTSFLAENVVCDSRDPSGGGGFADVYKGRIGNNPVALKVLRIHAAGAVLEKVEKDFCREALIWRQLKHPNILPFLGISKTAFPGRLCMVAPWMDSGNILGYLASQPTVDRKALLLQVASGLVYLHERSPSVVHGDVRGANILINAQGQPCLADFGLAILVDSLATMTSSSTSNTRGNVRWLPPEVLNPTQFGGGYLRKEPAVDVYSFAGLCYEVYTGEIPYYAQRSDFQVMTDVLGGIRPARPSASMTEELSDTVWDCMEKCWAHIASERPTMYEVANTFREAEVQVFGITPVNLNLQETRKPSGRLNCAEPFLSRDGQKLIFLGYDNGLWLGSRRSGDLRRVMKLKNVTHCAVLHALGVVLVLGDESIRACAIHDLITSGKPESVRLHRVHPRLLDHQPIMFVAGTVRGRTFVVYLRNITGREEFYAMSGSDMTWTICEANEEIISEPTQPSSTWLSRIVHRKPRWFTHLGSRYTYDSKLHRGDVRYEYDDCKKNLLDLCFMDDGLAILTQNGVLVSPEIPAGRGELVYKLALPAPPEGPPINLLYNAFPPKPKCVETLWTLEADSYCSEHPNPPTLEADSCCSEHPNPPPIGIHPCDDEKYLVCYPAFGAFLNYEHGELDRVHWKVSAHQVAFYWPYVLLFSRDQIEVRNICTGTFIQMIGDLGTDLRCIWDNPQHLADTSGVICVSGDSTGIRMFEIQPIE